MSMTVGYYSGYFAGMCTGVLVGWIASVLFGSRDDDENLYGDKMSSPPSPQTEDVSSDGNSDHASNVIYFRFTDKAFAELLTRMGSPNTTGLNFNDGIPTSTDNTQTPTATPNTTSATAESATPKVFQSETIGEDETEDIFYEADTAARVEAKTLDEILDVGRNMPTRPVSYLTSTTGGYATMGQLEDIGKKHSEYKNATLKRSDELEIMHAFRGIVGQKYYEAQEMVKGQGYTLHPLYFGKGRKCPAQLYSATTLGVRVEDKGVEEEWPTGVPSIDAVVTEIIDVGGIDAKNRGLSKH